jgi:hypothetical protein
MSGKITLVSPPDVHVNNNYSIILINTTEEEQDIISHWLSSKSLKKEITIYFYNNENNLQWLVAANAIAKCKYINLSNTRDNAQFLSSFILSYENCYYSLKDDNMFEIFKLVNTSKVDSIEEFLDRVVPIEHDEN